MTQASSYPETGAADEMAHPDSDVLRRQIVDVQLDYIAALEGLPNDLARAVQEHQGGLVAHGKRTELQKLKPWPGLSERNCGAYEQPHNRARIVRLLDYLLEGDRLLDVGCGFGYVTGILLRHAKLACYHGIDLGAHRVAAAREMLSVNKITHPPATFEQRSLFDLDAACLERCRPSLIVVLEVIEHVTDPVAALQAVFRYAPADADVLFTTPLAGRLEDVPSHVSFFNAERLQYICRKVGVNLHYVEPIADRWMQVLISRRTGVTPRVAALCERTQRHRPEHTLATVDFGISTKNTVDAGARHATLSARARAPLSALAFKPVRFPRDAAACAGRWRHGTREMKLKRVGNGIACRVMGGVDRGRGQYGGVYFDVEDVCALRLRVSLERAENIVAMCVDGYRAGGERCARWAWKPVQPDATTGRQETYVFVDAESTAHFRPEGVSALGRARRIEVFVRVRPMREAGFTLHRAEVAAEPR